MLSVGSARVSAGACLALCSRGPARRPLPEARASGGAVIFACDIRLKIKHPGREISDQRAGAVAGYSCFPQYKLYVINFRIATLGAPLHEVAHSNPLGSRARSPMWEVCDFEEFHWPCQVVHDTNQQAAFPIAESIARKSGWFAKN